MVPIFKNKGSRKNAEQYRPVSLINSMSKIIEKIVYQRISTFLNKKISFLTNNLDLGNACPHHMQYLYWSTQLQKNMNKIQNSGYFSGSISCLWLIRPQHTTVQTKPLRHPWRCEWLVPFLPIESNPTSRNRRSIIK